MKTSFALLTVLALALTGCEDNLASVEIFGICAPPDDAGTCGMSGTCGAYLASDRPFVYQRAFGLVNRLQEFVQINNQLPNNENVDIGRVNTNDFVAEEYLLSFLGVPNVGDVVHPANFTVPAQGSMSPVIPIIPEAAMAAIDANSIGNQTVVVEVRVRGHFVDATEHETGPYQIAVDVIDGNYPGITCPTAGDIAVYCPNAGQTASVSCETP